MESELVSNNSEEDEESYSNQEDSDAEPDENSDQEDNADQDEYSETYDNIPLPEHACNYCGVHNINNVVKCNEKNCQKWFCNSKGCFNAGSHIIMHLVKSRHNEIVFHPESTNKDTPVECYFCSNRNLFVLGTAPIKTSTSEEEMQVIFVCRRFTCVQPQAAKELSLKPDDWTSLIEDKAVVDWLIKPPSKKEEKKAKKITLDEITKLEALRKVKPEATLQDLRVVAVETKLPEVQLKYSSESSYIDTFIPLIDKEAADDKKIKESQSQSNITIRWEENIKRRWIAIFVFPSQEDFGTNYFIGNELKLHVTLSDGRVWSGKGSIIKVTNDDEIYLELITKNPPPNITSSYTVEFVWKSTTTIRMKKGLKRFCNDHNSISTHIYKKILGRNDVSSKPLNIEIPKTLSAPNLPELNISQIEAVKKALSNQLCLIQGPPGTGKTVTCATIVYHLVKMLDRTKSKGQVLVCAPSNIVVDHLAERIDQTGLKVIRLCSKSRETVSSLVEKLTLQNQVRALTAGSYTKLQKYFELLETTGELSNEDEKEYQKLYQDAEQDLLMMADVICCTCITAADRRLKKLSFNHVLIDEATQAIEPECLLPMLHGAKHVVMVGDHMQLGPVVISREASKAGLNRSLFERLVKLNNKPIRLQVQYRMHPELAVFPSYTFYDGTLQNGISASDRILDASEFPWPNRRKPMFFWHIKGVEELSASGTSYLNRTEAQQIEKIIYYLIKSGIYPSQIGIITPYKGQRAQIIYHLQKYGGLNLNTYKEIEIASIDSFQGREKDFIVLSCVRSSETSGIGFLSDYRRLNVTITRARYGLIILGNAKVLSKHSLWNNLLIHFKENHLLMEGPSLFSLVECSFNLKEKSHFKMNNQYFIDDNKSTTSSVVKNDPLNNLENEILLDNNIFHNFPNNFDNKKKNLSEEAWGTTLGGIVFNEKDLLESKKVSKVNSEERKENIKNQSDFDLFPKGLRDCQNYDDIMNQQ